MKNKILVANWKMHPATSLEAQKILKETKKGMATISGLEVYVCPPVIFLPELKKVVGTKIVLGTQDVFYEKIGAYTGQISPVMATSYGAHVTILGHSERRALGDDNVTIAKKVSHACREKMTVILCVGEKERLDDGAYFTFIREELETVLTTLKRSDLSRLIIAYEPIWAIGKYAENALSTDLVYEMVLFIRKLITEHFGRAVAARVPILYGASVKAENARDFIQHGGVDGLLVGSASLDSSQFVAIAKAIIS